MIKHWKRNGAKYLCIIQIVLVFYGFINSNMIIMNKILSICTLLYLTVPCSDPKYRKGLNLILRQMLFISLATMQFSLSFLFTLK